MSKMIARWLLLRIWKKILQTNKDIVSDAKIDFLSKLIQKLCHLFQFFELIMQI